MVVGRYGRAFDRYVNVWRRWSVYSLSVHARHGGTGGKEESEARLTAFDSDKVRANVHRVAVSTLSDCESVEVLGAPNCRQCTENGHERRQAIPLNVETPTASQARA